MSNLYHRILNFIYQEQVFPGIEEIPNSIDDFENMKVETSIPENMYINSGNKFHRHYETKRMSCAINYWIKSEKKFFVINEEYNDDTYYPLDPETLVFEQKIDYPGKESELEYKSLTEKYNFIVIKPYNLFVYDEVTGKYTHYTRKLKISI